MRSSFSKGLTVSCTKGRPVMLYSRSKASVVFSTGCYKTLLYLISALKNKFKPRNTTGIPGLNLFFCLELEEIFIL